MFDWRRPVRTHHDGERDDHHQRGEDEPKGGPPRTQGHHLSGGRRTVHDLDGQLLH